MSRAVLFFRRPGRAGPPHNPIGCFQVAEPIGEACAEIGAFAAEIRKHNLAILNDSQRLQLQDLADSIHHGASVPDRDIVVMDEARSANLLPTPALIKTITEATSRDCSPYWAR